MIEADQQTSQNFVQGSDAMLADIVASTKNITDALIDKIEVSRSNNIWFNVNYRHSQHYERNWSSF